MKKVLTTNSEAPINVECIMNDVDASGLITREVFEEAATPVLDRLLSPIKQVRAGVLRCWWQEAATVAWGTSCWPNQEGSTHCCCLFSLRLPALCLA
jgi:hypothetical protein